MDFAVLPPEVNSGLMYAGAGSGPLTTAAASWNGLAAELSAAAHDYGSIVATVTSGPWRGPASASMAAAAAPYVAWMSGAANQAAQTAAQAKSAAGAYETAFAMTVPPPLIAANRAQLAALVATNFLGQNTPAIAATEAQYGEMWVQDATAMYGYAGSSAAASTFTPFTEPPATTTAMGPGVQAPQAALSQLTAAIPQALQGLSSPAGSTSSVSGASGWMDWLGLSGSDLSSPAGILNLLSGADGSPLGTFLNANLWNTIFSSGFYSPGNLALCDFLGLAGVGAAAGDAAGSAEGALGAAAADGLGGALAAPLGGLGGAGGVAASLGQASSIGALSVPPVWTAPIGAATAALEGSNPGVVSAGGPGGPAGMLGGLPLAAAPGHNFAATPKYGFRPTVMTHPPAAG